MRGSIATVGLGVSDFGYHSRFGGFMHGFGAQAYENEETVSHEECINTAFLHCNCS